MAANIFAQIAVPVLSDGTGASTPITGQGLKTIIVGGAFVATVIIEVGILGGNFVPIATFDSPDQLRDLPVIASDVRVRIVNHRSGQAIVFVGGSPAVNQFGALAVPAANATGAAFDTSLFGPDKTIVMGGAFDATVTFEVSEDAGGPWAALGVIDKTANLITGNFVSRFVRARVTDYISGAPTASVGGADFGLGGNVVGPNPSVLNGLATFANTVGDTLASLGGATWDGSELVVLTGQITTGVATSSFPTDKYGDETAVVDGSVRSYGVNPSMTTTVNGANFLTGIGGAPQIVVFAGITDSGIGTGAAFNVLRSDVLDAGTLATLRGLSIALGHSGAMTGHTDLMMGLSIRPFLLAGSFTTVYGSRIQTPLGAVAPVNQWSYVSEWNAPSHFSGRLQVGGTFSETTVPTEALVVVEDDGTASARARIQNNTPAAANINHSMVDFVVNTDVQLRTAAQAVAYFDTIVDVTRTGRFDLNVFANGSSNTSIKVIGADVSIGAPAPIPLARLHVVQDGSGDAAIIETTNVNSILDFVLQSARTTPGNGASRIFFNSPGSPSAVDAKNFALTSQNGAVLGENLLIWSARNDDGSGARDILVMRHNGNVGIGGTPVSGSKCDVLFDTPGGGASSGYGQQIVNTNATAGAVASLGLRVDGLIRAFVQGRNDGAGEGSLQLGCLVGGVFTRSMSVEGDRNRNLAFVNLDTSSELTIAGGAITATKSFHTVDTEGDAPTDNLDTINGGVDGDRLVLIAEDNARTVVVRSVGNIALNVAGDFSMDNNSDTIELIFHRAFWRELSRSDNGP